MNKILKTAAVACFAISAANADYLFWDLTESGGHNEIGGYWYDYNDKNEKGGGCSSTDFPAGSMDEDVVSSAWQAKGGAITYTYTGACTYEYPFAGTGSNWFEDDPPKTVSEFGSNPLSGCEAVKVYYSLSESTANCKIELGADGATAYDNYTAALPAGDNISSGKSFAFSTFKQEGWGTKGVTWDNAVQASTAFKFKCDFRSGLTTAKTTVLTLKKIEFLGNGCTGGSSPIRGGNIASSAKLNMISNNLFINGVNSDVKVDIVNLQGALVNSGIIGASKSISLSNLPSGVYMVRVNSLNLTQKIMVK